MLSRSPSPSLSVEAAAMDDDDSASEFCVSDSKGAQPRSQDAHGETPALLKMISDGWSISAVEVVFFHRCCDGAAVCAWQCACACSSAFIQIFHSFAHCCSRCAPADLDHAGTPLRMCPSRGSRMDACML